MRRKNDRKKNERMCHPSTRLILSLREGGCTGIEWKKKLEAQNWQKRVGEEWRRAGVEKKPVGDGVGEGVDRGSAWSTRE
ncbi:MAG TPA: hypothetical protein EYO58_13205 [Flavobacteriales bacterium]|nr:hypothetical protein [Flavobacteriales bacterium]